MIVINGNFKERIHTANIKDIRNVNTVFVLGIFLFIHFFFKAIFKLFCCVILILMNFLGWHNKLM